MTTGVDRPVSVHASDAFEPLYSRYVRDVYRYSLALLGNRSDAEDATQTAFLNAYRAYRRGERPREPLNWLIVIAHNACLERRRRALRRPEEVPLDGEPRGLPVVDYDQADDVRELLDALDDLPFGQRAALVLREVGGRSYEEIAEILGTSVKAVDMALMRARRALRRRRASLGALWAVDMPARLCAKGAGGALAQAAGLTAPVPLAAKALAIIAAGLVAGAPGAGTAVEAEAAAALRSTERAAAARATAVAPPSAGRVVTARTARAHAQTKTRAGRAGSRGATSGGVEPSREVSASRAATSGDVGSRASTREAAAAAVARDGEAIAARAAAASAAPAPPVASAGQPSAVGGVVETTNQVVAAASPVSLPAAPSVTVPSTPAVSVPAAPAVTAPSTPSVSVPPAPSVSLPPLPSVSLPPLPSVSPPSASPAPSAGVSLPGVRP